jgi:hypothetical protein
LAAWSGPTTNRIRLGGNKVSIKYSGKVEGDVFKGKREIDRDGEVSKLDFEAKRVKE